MEVNEQWWTFARSTSLSAIEKCQCQWCIQRRRFRHGVEVAPNAQQDFRTRTRLCISLILYRTAYCIGMSEPDMPMSGSDMPIYWKRSRCMYDTKSTLSYPSVSTLKGKSTFYKQCMPQPGKVSSNTLTERLKVMLLHDHDIINLYQSSNWNRHVPRKYLIRKGISFL